MAFWARAFEKVCKLSMLYAVSQNPVKPVISVDAVKWASAFVEFVTDQMLWMVDNYSYESLFDEKCRKAVRYIRQAGGKMKHSDLLKQMHASKEEFKQITISFFNIASLCFAMMTFVSNFFSSSSNVIRFISNPLFYRSY